MQVHQKSIVKAWLHAFRLRTLPLSLSGILMGAILAYFNNHLNIGISSLAFLTTLFLQILSNLANDYGDAVKGTDNDERVGPDRAVQSGMISRHAMKKAIVVFSGLSLMSGLLLLFKAFGQVGDDFPYFYFFFFLLLGLGAIAAAIKYTVGKNAYGYSGLGDLFVFIFFGLVSVSGTYFLNGLHWNNMVLLPAVTLGLYSVAVLNLNNMRDRVNDQKSGKYTVVVKMGLSNAKVYHGLLLMVGLSASVVFTILNYVAWYQFIYLILLPFMFIDMIRIAKVKEEYQMDPFLKKQAIKTLVFCLLFGLGIYLSFISSSS